MTVEQPEGGRDELADLRAEVERLRLSEARMSANAEHWSYVAERTEAERDALQRQATRVRRHVESKAVTSRARGRADEEREWLDVLALLDAVEPADQPHPTTEADDPRPCKGRNGNVCVAEGCYGEACRRAGS